jgi:hypothetical protein
MAHVNAIAGAGATEAARLAQTVIHRGAETGALVVSGQREDRLRAERIPEAREAERVSERGARERREGDEGRGEREPEREPGDDSPSGALVDLQA